MAREITSETMDEILSRCLLIPIDSDDGNTMGVTCRGSSGQGTTVWKIHGRFGVPADLHEYWQDYVRNELVRRDIADATIQFRKVQPDPDQRPFALRRLLSFGRDSEQILTTPVHEISYTTGPRRYHHIFLVHEELTGCD